MSQRANVFPRVQSVRSIEVISNAVNATKTASNAQAQTRALLATKVQACQFCLGTSV